MSVFNKFSLLLFLLIAFGCGSNKQVPSTTAQIEDLNALVSNKSFVINVNTARPLATGTVSRVANAGLLPPGSNVGRIDLTGMSSFLRVVKDSVTANLPYYGERQISAPYNSKNTGVRFDGIPQDFEISPNEKTSGYTVQFRIRSGTEAFDVSAELLPDLSSTININSTHRTAIWYNGSVAKYSSE
ncbi:DUF4251 domain-containing protein [Flagellimonas sp. S3867]|uniref:DUF4251 domain-containing protein n=1 Tax=Flagellimonas sp. S3867 TaxID=2768063 RepID=UPI001681CFA0|nr:DUF4251 domain-containing protein [Flagellimonas sp. S3867]